MEGINNGCSSHPSVTRPFSRASDIRNRRHRCRRTACPCRLRLGQHRNAIVDGIGTPHRETAQRTGRYRCHHQHMALLRRVDLTPPLSPTWHPPLQEGDQRPARRGELFVRLSARPVTLRQRAGLAGASPAGRHRRMQSPVHIYIYSVEDGTSGEQRGGP